MSKVITLYRVGHCPETTLTPNMTKPVSKQEIAVKANLFQKGYSRKPILEKISFFPKKVHSY